MSIILKLIKEAINQPPLVYTPPPKPVLSPPVVEVSDITQTTAVLSFLLTDAPIGVKYYLDSPFYEGFVTSPYILTGLSPESDYSLTIGALAEGYIDSELTEVSFTTLEEGPVIPPEPVYANTTAMFLGDSFFGDFFLHRPVNKKIGFKDFVVDAQGGRRLARTSVDDGRPALVDTIDATIANKPTAGFVWIEPIVNDAFRSVPIGDPSSTEKTTFYGALKYVANAIKTGLPNAIVYYSTPMQNPAVSLDTLRQYIAAQNEIFDAAGFNKIDVFNSPLLSIDKINQISTDNIHPDKPYGQGAYTSVIENAIVPLVAPVVKTIQLVDATTLSVTFDSSIANFSLSGLSLIKSGSQVSFDSFNAIQGSILNDLPQSTFYLNLPQAIQPSDVIQLNIVSSSVKDYFDNVLADANIPVSNNVADLGEIVNFGDSDKLILNATWDSVTKSLLVQGNGGSTGNKRVTSGAFEYGFPETFRPANNAILAILLAPFTPPPSADGLLNQADFSLYWDPATGQINIFEKGVQKFGQQRSLKPVFYRDSNNKIVAKAGSETLYTSDSTNAGTLYLGGYCYSVTSSVKAYIKSPNLQSY